MKGVINKRLFSAKDLNYSMQIVVPSPVSDRMKISARLSDELNPFTAFRQGDYSERKF